ncbi:hypothetical protein ACQVP2_06515 [Methylobacterium aquaticum]|uniref:hypothetical protein n=1 Tax=Methylobacterium aquaticum TaxID=270351 RepID=UPI003D1851CB
MRGNYRGGGIERLDGAVSRGEGGGDIRIIVSAPPVDDTRERALSYVPWPIKLVMKLVLPVGVLLGIVVLPNYLDCRHQHDVGMFFHGMTVAACTRQSVYGQIGATQKRFEEIARAIAVH